MLMKWKPINELNRSESQHLLVTQDGLIRLLFWSGSRRRFEDENGGDVLPLDPCGQPTHFMPLPPLPDAPA